MQLCFTKLCQWSLFQACDRQLSTVSWKVPTLISKIKDFFLFWDYTEVKTTPNQHIDYFDSLQGERKLKNYHCCWSFSSPEQLCRPAKNLNIFILFWQMLLSHQTIRNWNMLHVAQWVTLLPLQLWVMGHHFSVPRPSSGKTNFPGEGQPSKSKYYLWSHFNLTVIPKKKKQLEVSEKSTTQGLSYLICVPVIQILL